VSSANNAGTLRHFSILVLPAACKDSEPNCGKM